MSDRKPFANTETSIATRAAQFACTALGILAGMVLLGLGEGLALKLSGVNWSPKQSVRHVSIGDFSISGDGRWGVSRVTFSRERAEEGFHYDLILHDLERNVAKRCFFDSCTPLVVAISPAADRCAIGGADGSLYVAQLSSGDYLGDIALAAIRRLRILDTGDAFGDLAFSPDGTILAAASQSHVWIWRMPNGQLIHSISNDIDWRTDLTFSKDSRLLLFAGKNGFAHLCDVRSGDKVKTANLRTGAVAASALSSDARRAAFITADGRLCLWSFAQNREIWRESVSDGAPRKVAFSPDGRHVATAECGMGTSKIQLLEASTGRATCEIARASDTMGIAFCKEGSLFSWNCRGEIYAWNIKQRREQWRFSASQAGGVL